MSSNSPKKPPIFHENHGNDVKTFHDVALGTNTKYNGLVFTSKPVKPNEKIYLKPIKVSGNGPNIISIGFTSRDPSSLHSISKCTRSELKHKQGLWMCQPPRHFCKEKKILFFYVTKTGSIQFGIDDEEKQTFDKKVDTRGKLWALIDVWSSGTTIQMVDINKIQETNHIIHQTCGRNVRISQNSIRKLNFKLNFSYAFTSRPIKIDEHITIKILTEGNLIFGVTSCDPDNMSVISLPIDTEALLDRPEYWIVIKDSTWNFEPNDEISFEITIKGEMKIWKNRSLLLKKLYVDQNSKLWGFFCMDTVQAIKVLSSTATPPETPTEKQPDTLFDDASSTCVVCCENELDGALNPCGHLCMCFTCAEKQQQSKNGSCPICRVKIINVLKIYKP